MARSKTAKKKAPRSPALAPKKAAKVDPVKLVAAARKAAFTTNDPKLAFDHYRSLAERVATAELGPFTGQPLLMRHNVLAALATLEPHLGVAAARLQNPGFREAFELPTLVLALDYAVGRVPVVSLSRGEIADMLREGSPWRELTLSFLEIVSHPLLALVPRERVAAVRKGTGKLDSARDFVAIPGLFAEFAGALEGKHPFPPETLERLGVLGSALVAEMQPGGAVVAAAPRSPEAILRDQLAKLVEDGYDALQVIATVALGKRAADEMLPALRTKVGVAAKEPTAAPEPAVPGDGAQPPA
jgi:hypothetical protein